MKRSDPRIERGIVEFAALAFFLILVIVFFAPVLFGGYTLLPFDNLYRFPPWQQFAQALGVTQPHNLLLDDLVLENYPWKKFILDSLGHGELPLWNPYILAGQPFLAAGQNAALYPLGLLFLILPLTRVYGIFVALHFWIAATAMYLLARVLRLRPLAATASGVVYAFSGFMVVSVVFPMVISAAAWLPAILAAIELTLKEEEKRAAGDASYSPPRELLFAISTAVLLGVQFLAGHVEISYYILMVLAFYSIWRVIGILGTRPRAGTAEGKGESGGATSPHPSFARRGEGQSRSVATRGEGRSPSFEMAEEGRCPSFELAEEGRSPSFEMAEEGRSPSLRRRGRGRLLSFFARLMLVLAGIVTLGFGLAGIQLIPLYELLQRNFRAGSVSYDQVAGWALPLRQILTFVIPDFFGNPTHHSYLDVFNWTIRQAPTGTIFWGIKNYVEAGSYVGILPLVLALLAIAWSAAYYLLRVRRTPPAQLAPLNSLIPTRCFSPSSQSFRCSLRSARRSMPSSFTLCRATTNYIPRSDGYSHLH